LRKLSTLLLLFVLMAVAHGQKSTVPSCENPTNPVNGFANKPPIPPSTWRAPRSAVVGLDLTIDTKGNVKDAVVIYSGGRDADNAVLEAVRSWTYTPAMCGSTPVETKIHVKINLQVGRPER